MAKTKWRALNQYHPCVQLMIEYMWNHRPPLLPAEFADRLGVSRQVVSRWLLYTYDPAQPAEGGEGGEAPGNDPLSPPPGLSPAVAVRLARMLDKPVSQMLLVAGLTTGDDPLYDRAEAWAAGVAELRALAERAPNWSEDERAQFLQRLDQLQQAALQQGAHAEEQPAQTPAMPVEHMVVTQGG